MRKVSICIKLIEDWDSYKDIDPEFLLEDLQEIYFDSTSFLSEVPNSLYENFAIINLELSDNWNGMNKFEIYHCLKSGEYEGVKFVSIEPYFKKIL